MKTVSRAGHPRSWRSAGIGTVLGVLLATHAPASTDPTPGTSRSPGAAPMPGLPEELLDVSFDQRLGDSVPLDLSFRDETGAEVPLAHYFGDRPVVLSLVYYECPMLCSMALNGLTRSLRVLDLDVGDEFAVVTLSFDPKDTPALAREMKERYVRRLGQPGAAQGWHFLTGDEAPIDSLTATVGFRYVYDEGSGQYAHAAGIVVLTPEGVVARTLLGIEYSARDLRLALVEASEGRVGNVIDQALLYCFQYDPSTGTYSAIVMRIVRLAGMVSITGFGLLFWVLRRRERARGSSSGARWPSTARGGP